jgi:hypothetical protein
VMKIQFKDMYKHKEDKRNIRNCMFSNLAYSDTSSALLRGSSLYNKREFINNINKNVNNWDLLMM